MLKRKVKKLFKTYVEAEGRIEINKETGKAHSSVYVEGDKPTVCTLIAVLTHELIERGIFTVEELCEAIKISAEVGEDDESK